MTKNRMVNTHLWRDTWVDSLAPPEKLLFLYLITNPDTNVIGVYEIRVAQIALDTGIEESQIERMLQKFQASGRVTYMEGWMIVHNFEKHQSLKGELIEKAKETLTKNIPDRVYKAYQSPLHNVSADTSISNLIKSNQLKSDETEKVAKMFNADINDKSQLTDSAKRKIRARLKTYSSEDIAEAVANFSKDRWQMRHNAHRGMAWFFHSDDRIEQYINLKTKPKVEL